MVSPLPWPCRGGQPIFIDTLILAILEALKIAESGAPVLVDVLCEQRVSASTHAERGVETAGTGKR